MNKAKTNSNIKDVVYLSNASTKFTSFIISIWVLENGGKVYYYTPEGNILDMDSGLVVSSIKENILTISDFFETAGYTITSTNNYKEKLGNKIDLLFEFYKKLIKENFFCKVITDKQLSSKNLNKLNLYIKKEQKILDKHLKTFYGHETLNFSLSGYALEFFTFETLKRSRFFDEVKVNINIEDLDKNLRNEIDVAAVKNNILYYFSCKKTSKKLNNDEHIRRVSSLSKIIGGRFSVPVLVSCHHSPVLKKKAKDLGVNFINPSQLIDLLENPQAVVSKWRDTAFNY